MKIDLANVLDRKFLLRKLEKEFQRIKISRFSGGSKPSLLPPPPKRLTPSALASFIDDLKIPILDTRKVGRCAVYNVWTARIEL